MRYLYPLLLIVLLVTCKKEDEGPAPEMVTQNLPTGLLSFTIDEVPQENIRFATIEQNGPHHDRIVITLPKEYAKGDEMTVTIKMMEGFLIRDGSMNEYNPSEMKLNFSKTGCLAFTVYDKKNDVYPGAFYLYVDPTIPMTAPSTGKNYEETLDGTETFVYIPVQNLGTAETITENNKWVSDVEIFIKNKKTGVVTPSRGAYYLENPNNDLFAMIPAAMEAGEYELTVQKQNRKVVIPDALVLKYGKSIVRMLPFTSASKDTSNSISYSGYNLLPEHKYIMELKNDFTSPKRVTLSPTNYLTLKQEIPASFPSGNYEATLFIDGKEMPSYWNYNRNILEIKKDARQPSLATLSNERNAVLGEVTLYKAITTFKKSEPIIADLRDGGNKSNIIMFLKNVASGKTFELPFSGKTDSFIPFSLFNIPKEVPVGKYEVFVSEVDKISERYHKIITIE
ncbi:hypothetical protein [Dyadobacter sp. CY347]|uniref:hypothetical protein n=1 Tax=Dyadobacter sp. CY347 TaxID=2909336 RepID=UPI001F3D08C9|nr:hypothetical protein [Dyadobacter sp. CY347]MCF2489157.1 hypothetical protein [Dyadobacter sp. CY347]